MNSFFIIKSLLHFSMAAGIFVTVPQALAAARLYVSPASGTYTVGDTIQANVMIDTGGEAINSAEGSMSYPEDTLEYQAVHTTSVGSIFSFWTTGPTGGKTGLSFSGGLPNPGYTGSAGKVLTVAFKAKAPGTATISVTGQKILANDGNGTNIYGSSSGATFTIRTPATPKPGITITSTTHPDSGQWYNAKDAQFSWRGSNSSITSFAFIFDQSPSTEPSNSFSTNREKRYDNIGDGVWYFHVKGRDSSNTVTATQHFKVQIDTVAPEDFTISLIKEGGTTDPRPKVTFAASDALSGISSYEARVDDGEWFSIQSGDMLPKLPPGDHTLIVRAKDKAGNTKESSASYRIEGISPPTLISWAQRIGLFERLNFIGRSSVGDTIIVYLDDKEVARFHVKDHQITAAHPHYPSNYQVNDGERVWEFVYPTTLLPGAHSFRFARINEAGAASVMTQPYRVSVVISTMRLFGIIVATDSFILGLLMVIFSLVIIIYYLQLKLRLAIKSGGRIAGTYYRLAGFLRQAEKEIDKQIDTTLPNHDLTKGSVIDARNNLKKKVHTIIENEKSKLE